MPAYRPLLLSPAPPPRLPPSSRRAAPLPRWHTAYHTVRAAGGHPSAGAVEADALLESRAVIGRAITRAFADLLEGQRVAGCRHNAVETADARAAAADGLNDGADTADPIGAPRWRRYRQRASRPHASTGSAGCTDTFMMAWPAESCTATGRSESGSISSWRHATAGIAAGDSAARRRRVRAGGRAGGCRTRAFGTPVRPRPPPPASATRPPEVQATA